MSKFCSYKLTTLTSTMSVSSGDTSDCNDDSDDNLDNYLLVPSLKTFAKSKSTEFNIEDSRKELTEVMLC